MNAVRSTSAARTTSSGSTSTGAVRASALEDPAASSADHASIGSAGAGAATGGGSHSSPGSCWGTWTRGRRRSRDEQRDRHGFRAGPGEEAGELDVERDGADPVDDLAELPEGDDPHLEVVGSGGAPGRGDPRGEHGEGLAEVRHAHAPRCDPLAPRSGGGDRPILGSAQRQPGAARRRVWSLIRSPSSARTPRRIKLWSARANADRDRADARSSRCANQPATIAGLPRTPWPVKNSAARSAARRSWGRFGIDPRHAPKGSSGALAGEVAGRVLALSAGAELEPATAPGQPGARPCASPTLALDGPELKLPHARSLLPEIGADSFEGESDASKRDASAGESPLSAGADASRQRGCSNESRIQAGRSEGLQAWMR
jgi:hypothetical protein